MELNPVASSYVDLGVPVHVVDFGGSGDPIVLVHGLGGSHVNWAAVGYPLSAYGHVTALDLPGFGLSPPFDSAAGLFDNRDVLDRYLRSIGRPVTLIGNSMGGTLSMMQAALAPETVERLVLVSPAAPFLSQVRPDPLVAAWFAAYLVPGLGHILVSGRRALVDPARVARLILDLCAARSNRIAPEVVAQHVYLAERRQYLAGIDDAFLRAVRTLLAFVGRSREFDEYVAAITAPTLVVHGDRDRLVPAAAARRLGALRPDWEVEILADVGHIAMLEVPATFVNLVGNWMRRSVAA